MSNNQDVTTTVERYHDYICSLEGVNNFTPGQSGMQRLVEMFNGVKHFTTGLFGSFAASTDIKIDLTKLIGIAESQDYVSMGKVPVRNPLRLSRPWVEYVTALETLQDLTDKIDENLLAPMTAYIGQGLNNPQLFNSLTFEPKGYEFVEVKPYKKELEKFLNGPNKEYVAWNKAFKRNSDVKSFAEKFNEILIKHAQLKPETVIEAVNKLNETAGALMNEVGDQNSEYVLNKKTATRLSEMILQVAQHVELYVITHNLIAEMERCALETQEAINFKK